MIEVKNITKNFDKIKALNGVSFSVGKGELLALLGPNGAGKTTLLRALTAYIPIDGGEILFEGKSVFDNTRAFLEEVGYMPEAVPLYMDMMVEEYLAFVGKVYRLEKNVYQQNFERLSKMLDIQTVLRQKIGTLSKGYKRRVALLSVLIHSPKILILDEPTEGLDPNQKMVMRQVLKEYAKDNLVIISTHILEEAEAISSRVILINNGKVIEDVDIAKFRALAKGESLTDLFYRLTCEGGV